MTNKKETSGVLGGEKWTAGRRRPRRHRFVCVRNFQVIQICNQQSDHHNITWHHVTLSQVTPQHHSTSLPFVSPFCRISKRFLPLQVSFEKVSHEMRFERSGHETFTLHFRRFRRMSLFSCFFFDLSCNLLGKSCFFSSDTESWMVKRRIFGVTDQKSPGIPLSLRNWGRWFYQLRPCWASIGACYPWSETLLARTKASQISCFNSLRWIQPFGGMVQLMCSWDEFAIS